MTTTLCHAVMMDAETGVEDRYDFEMEKEIFTHPAHEVVDAFFKYLQRHHETPKHGRWELNSAIRNKDKRLVTSMGHLILPHGEIPFMVMIWLDKENMGPNS